MKQILILESLIILLKEQLLKAKSRKDFGSIADIETLIGELQEAIDNEKAE